MSVTKWSQDVDFVEIRYEFQEKEIINCSFDEEMIYINVGKKTLNVFLFSEIIPERSYYYTTRNILLLYLKKKVQQDWSNYSLIASS